MTSGPLWWGVGGGRAAPLGLGLGRRHTGSLRAFFSNLLNPKLPKKINKWIKKTNEKTKLHALRKNDLF